ncbi:MAG: hypothetical protein MK081_12745 [Flavobacteriales bacterium]|nr:hypothetical protein [Flavobacteriales bacterium]
MKIALNLLLVLSSFIGYLEWGDGNSQLLIQMEGEILRELTSDPASILHPLIILPMIGQGVLLFTLRQTQPNKWLTLLGIVCIGALMVIILIAGIAGQRGMIILSTVLFLTIAIFTIYQHFLKVTRV